MLFETGHLSSVVGVSLDDGREVVVKARPPSPRIAACFAVQRDLHVRGFPCPEPLAGPEPLGSLLATAEAHVPRLGEPPSSPPAAASASLLASLVRLAPAAVDHPDLEPSPPWVGWDHGGEGLWPAPDDLIADLDLHAGPEWVDGAARRLRERLAVPSRPAVIGHADWEAQNLDWCDGAPTIVHDWDSLATRPEPAIAGAAAAVYVSAGPLVAATLPETHTFLDAYRRACAPWSRDDIETAWAAGTWVLTYNAKKETLGGGTGYVAHLEPELDERLRLAGC